VGKQLHAAEEATKLKNFKLFLEDLIKRCNGQIAGVNHMEMVQFKTSYAELPTLVG
jgi:hypothetical protein